MDDRVKGDVADFFHFLPKSTFQFLKYFSYSLRNFFSWSQKSNSNDAGFSLPWKLENPFSELQFRYSLEPHFVAIFFLYRSLLRGPLVQTSISIFTIFLLLPCPVQEFEQPKGRKKRRALGTSIPGGKKEGHSGNSFYWSNFRDFPTPELPETLAGTSSSLHCDSRKWLKVSSRRFPSNFPTILLV